MPFTNGIVKSFTVALLRPHSRGRVTLDAIDFGDASVFDVIPRANTHLSTLALAEKLGCQL